MWDIVRWDPLRDMAALRNETRRLMGRLGEEGNGVTHAPWSPATDVFETADAVVITAELPGVKDEDVEVTVQDGVLTIRGERRLEEEVQKDRYHRIERSYGSFARSFNLAPGIKEEDISVGVAYGVLRVSIPKPKRAEPRRIPIAKAA
jgi:HSP20 family protein